MSLFVLRPLNTILIHLNASVLIMLLCGFPLAFCCSQYTLAQNESITLPIPQMFVLKILCTSIVSVFFLTIAFANIGWQCLRIFVCQQRIYNGHDLTPWQLIIEALCSGKVIVALHQVSYQK